MNFSHKNDRLKPNYLKTSLDISEGKLRNWRDLLDPRMQKSYFSGRDLLMYGVFKLMIVAERIPTRELKIFDWAPIFAKCYESSINELKNCAVVFDDFDKRLFFTRRSNQIDTDDNFIHCVKFSNVIELFTKNTVDCGIDNTVCVKDNVIKVNFSNR